MQDAAGAVVDVIAGMRDEEAKPKGLAPLEFGDERIDLDAMDFRDVRAAHQEIPLMFMREDG